MAQWWQDIRKFLKLIVIFVSIIFFVFLINQCVTLYNLLAQIHPYVAIAGVALLVLAILWFAYKLYRQWSASPEVIQLSPEASDADYQDYVEKMLALLAKNPNLQDFDFADEQKTQEEKLDQAIAVLDNLSLPMIKQNANAIFLTTAVSQNGSLDSLVVLFSLMRMIWQLANVYQTRPSLKGFLKLYGQVASVVLMARTIEDADLIEGQLEPLIASLVGESVASAIPGMVPITNLVVSSLMEGSVNAFLTLRVGLITQAYLGMEKREDRSYIRRSAAMQSLTHMGSIIKENGKVIVKTVANAVKKSSMGTAKKWFNLDAVFNK